MKKLLTIIGLCMLTTNLFALPIIIDLGTTTGQPAGIDNEFQRLLDLIDNYNSSNNPDIPEPLENLGITYSINGGPKSIDVSFNDPFNGYLMFKWSDMDQFYYVENLEDYSFVSTVVNQNARGDNTVLLGLSHWNNWQTNVVPESGSTLVILGLGLTMIGVCGKNYHNRLKTA